MAVFTDLLGTLRGFMLLGPKASRLTLSWSALTAPRTVSFPDKDGTVAMLSDVASAAVPVDGGNASTVTTAPYFTVDFGRAT